MDQNHYHQPYTTGEWPEWNMGHHPQGDTDNSTSYVPPSSSSAMETTAYHQQGQYNAEFKQTTAQPQHQYQQEQHHMYTSSASADSPATYNELSEAVSKLEIHHPSPIPTTGTTARRNLRLSMDIQPFISITEPTPVQSSQRHFLVDSSIPVPPLPQREQRNDIAASPELTMVDEFIAQHMAQLEQQQQQQQHQQRYYQHQQHESINNNDVSAQSLSSSALNNLNHSTTSLDDLSFVKPELASISQDCPVDTSMLTLDPPSNGPAWLSWTPNGGNSPVTSEFEFEIMEQQPAPVATPIGPYTSFTTDSISTISNHHSHIDSSRLTTGVTTRPRRVSEPPRVSNPLELFDPLDFPFGISPFTQQNTVDFHAPSSISSNSPSPTSSTMMVPEQSSPRPIRRSHSDRRNSRGSASFPCQHPGCQKTFTRHYNLTSHMRTHTAERPFACTTCQRRFARQHDRNRHEKLHWGIKPFSCVNCQKSFARMDALNRHLRVNGCGGGISNTAH